MDFRRRSSSKVVSHPIQKHHTLNLEEVQSQIHLSTCSFLQFDTEYLQEPFHQDEKYTKCFVSYNKQWKNMVPYHGHDVLPVKNQE